MWRMNRSRPYDVATLVAALIVLAVITIASLAAIQPPPVRSRDAAVSEFSAVRALAVLKQLAGDNVPHPTGSARNEIVRERIVARLRALGYEPRVESKFVCGIYASCATVTNVALSLRTARRDYPAKFSFDGTLARDLLRQAWQSAFPGRSVRLTLSASAARIMSHKRATARSCHCR